MYNKLYNRHNSPKINYFSYFRLKLFILFLNLYTFYERLLIFSIIIINLMIFSEDPKMQSFYYPLIASYIAVLLFLYVLKTLLKVNQNNLRMSATLETLDPLINYNQSIYLKKESLRFRYMIAYIFTRSSIWAKGAYTYTLYTTIHGFSIREMGILYIIDGLSAMLVGPITGNLADIYGRKKFSMLYCVTVFTNLALRLTGKRSLAYVAQIFTGIGTGLVTCTLESWLNYEAMKDFERACDHYDESLLAKERFLGKIFKT